MRSTRAAAALLAVLLLAPGLAVARAAPPAVAAPPQDGVRLTLGPAPFRLGQDREGEVTVELPKEAGPPRLFASRGELSAPEPVSPGVWRARFRPPERPFPQLTILAAVADSPQGVLHGWTVVPLWGQGVAEVRTRPGAEVVLQVADERFGPVVADAQGHAEVPLLVPPTAQVAYHGTRPIPLGLPPVPRVHALAEQLRVRADEDADVTVRLYAVTPEGAPREQPPANVTATEGTLAAPARVAPGVFELRWHLPAGPASAPGLTAGDGSSAPPARLSLTREPGPAATFRFSASPETLRAAEGARVQLSAEALDRVGNPTRAALQVRSALGPALALAEAGPGRYAGALAVPPAHGGRTGLALALEADGREVAQASVALAPGEPGRLTVVPEATSVVADGRTRARYRVTLADAWGNPVPATAPPTLVRASDPAAGAALPAGPGAWTLELVPPRAAAPRVSQVELAHGALRATAALALEPPRARLTLAAHAGALTNFAATGAPEAGLTLAGWPGLLHPDLGAALDVGLLGFGHALPSGPGASGRYTLVGVGLAWRRFLPWGEAWASLGPALARVSSHAELARGVALDEAGWAFGAQGALGAGRRFGPGQPFLELRAGALSDPGLLGLRGSLRTLGLHVGYRVDAL